MLQTDGQTNGRANEQSNRQTDGRSGPTTRPAFAKATQVTKTKSGYARFAYVAQKGRYAYTG